MTQPYTIVTGCSFTEGIGLPDVAQDKNLWVNKLYHSSKELSTTVLLNLGKSGSTNIEIFSQAINALATYNCKYLIVSWTEVLRYKFSTGVELYNVDQYWSTNTIPAAVNLNCLTYSKRYLNNIQNRFFALHHDHAEIVKILNYTAIINRMCHRVGAVAYFVNGALPWDSGYFNHVSNNTRVPTDTTMYTQKLLNSNTRDDDEFFKIYDRMHHEYKVAGGVTECTWINLNDGFRQNFHYDYGTDNQHPGIVSHQQFGNYLIESFKAITDPKVA
jgi:hypothetical protein